MPSEKWAKDKRFIELEIQIAKMNVKRYSISLIIRDIQITI